MGTEIMITGETYKLRAGSPMPIGTGDFRTHTFMAERTQVDTYLYTNSLKGSEEFRGQGGNYISANFSRILDKGGESFQGSVQHNPEYVEETEV